MKKDFSTAVLIGRFEPVHNAHMESIQKGLDIAEEVIIVIGSYKRPSSIKNPMNYEERKKVIGDAIREGAGEPLNEQWTDKPPQTVLSRVTFVPMRDYLYNDHKWASNVYAKCLSVGADPGKKTVLIGCFKDDSSYYLKMFPKWEFKRFPYLYKLDSTDIRKEWFTKPDSKGWEKKTPPSVHKFFGKFKGTEEFKNLREEYAYTQDYINLWKAAPYPVTLVTVDSLLIKSGCVLLVKRGRRPGKGQLAIPGGYLDVKQTLMDSALRELKEETRVRIPMPTIKGSLQEKRVFDHPNRSLRGRVVTNVFLFYLGEGPLPETEASSDAEEAFWMPLSEIYDSEGEFFEDHFDIIVSLTSKY